MRRNIFLLAVAMVMTVVGCEKKSADGKATKQDLSTRTLQIVATTGMIADAAKNIGGQRVNVKALMGPGVDPHLYKASEGDVVRMSKADLILYNGLHLEGKMTDIFANMKRRIKTLAVSDGVEPTKLLSPAEFKGAHDPHIWFDVGLWKSVAEKIRDTLIMLDSTHAATYKKNAHAYLTELWKVHAYILQQAKKVPQDKRVLITAHDAFNYFGRAYGFEVRGLQGISTASEAGTADMKNLAEFIVKRKIPAVFVETSVPTRYIEALQAAVRSRGFEVAIGGQLFSDAMGSPDSPAGTYLGMVRQNIDTIVKGLSQ